MAARIGSRFLAFVVRVTLCVIALFLGTLPIVEKRAWACACCGGYSRAEPLGFSAAGELFLRVEIDSACLHFYLVQVFREGKASPSYCHDLLADPSKRIDCNKATFTDSYDAKPKPTTAIQASLLPLRSVNPVLLAANYVVQRSQYPRTAKLKLWGLLPLPPKTLLQLTLDEYEYSSAATEAPTDLIPIEFVLLPQPKPGSQKVAVLVRGMDSSPGTGHESFLLKWLTLDAQVEQVAGAVWSRALPSFRSVETTEPEHGPKLNSAGVRLLEKDDVDGARLQFEAAVAWDPAHVLARYNLACALARQGRTRAALFQLNELFTAASKPVVSERRERALVDPDLASVRNDPEFARIVCGGTCPTPSPPAATSALGVNSPGAPSPAGSESPTEPAGPPATAATVSPTPPAASKGCSLPAQRPAHSSGFAWGIGVIASLALRRRRLPVPRAVPL